MDQYRLQKEKGNGTFSVVFEATSVKTNQRVAIKCMKKKFESVEKVRKLKEIQALTLLSHHENVVKLIQVLFDEPTGKLALVFELMDMNLYEYLKGHRNIPMQKIKSIMFKVLKAIQSMHQKGIFHRDIKPENILITGDTVKLADLGSCRRYQNPQPYTDYISTRWYRAPQCLMTDGYYNEKMDIWGFGCVLFELITKYPLFPGKDELDQVHRINHMLGTPSQEVLTRFRRQSSHMDINFPSKKGTGLQRLLPNIPPDAKDFIKKLLQYDPELRISAQQALKHQFFSDCHDITLSSQKQYFQSTFLTVKHPTKSERDRSYEDKYTRKVQNGTSLSKPQKQVASKHNIERSEDISTFPKLNYQLDKSFHGPERKIHHEKKISLDFNLTVMQERKVF